MQGIEKAIKMPIVCIIVGTDGMIADEAIKGLPTVMLQVLEWNSKKPDICFSSTIASAFLYLKVTYQYYYLIRDVIIYLFGFSFNMGPYTY